MLLFHIGNELYACDSEPVVEVVPKIKLKSIPHSAPYVSGFMNFNGVPVPVIDFCQLLDDRPCSSAMHTRIVLIKNEANRYLGLMVEKMTEIFEEDLSNFLDSGLRVEKYPFLGGMLNQGELHVQFVIVNELFQLLE